MQSSAIALSRHAVPSGACGNMRSIEMHRIDSVMQVMALVEEGATASEIARLTGLARTTVRDWKRGALPRQSTSSPGCRSCPRCGAAAHAFADYPAAYMYLLGVYLGDGCISAHRRGVYRLRLFLDAGYPEIIAGCEAAIRTVCPANKIGRRLRSGGFPNSTQGSNVELSVYSRSWPCLFPQHGPGRKHERPIVLVDWQRTLLETHPKRSSAGSSTPTAVASSTPAPIGAIRTTRSATLRRTYEGSSARRATCSASTGPRRHGRCTYPASGTSRGSTSSSDRRPDRC